MRVARLIASILVLTLGSACATGEAFVDRNYMQKSTRKQKLPGYDGNVVVCYDSATPREKRDSLASETCEVYGLVPLLVTEQKWQCRMTVPHKASYACVDPQMRTAGGGYVNPFNASQVNAWMREHRGAENPDPEETAR